jgi:hypothetical protein
VVIPVYALAVRRWMMIVFAGVLVGCSGANNASGDTSTSIPVSTATADVSEQPTKTIPTSPSKVVTTLSISSEVSDTVAEPVLPDTATSKGDGVVSWEFATSVVDERVRRYVLDTPPNGLDMALEYEATSGSPHTWCQWYRSGVRRRWLSD